jgi:DNA (cytosine-5)-methyltransferase 1
MTNKCHKFPYKWYLKDGLPSVNVEKHNLKVFGIFVCGGGSSFGYKLTGYDHLGGVEIDKQIAPIYKLNHNPKYLYNEDIRDFRLRNDLPQELFELDILDGSPPCSVFSVTGKREEGWGIEKTFREGQGKQSLDDLFFEYIALAKRLQPKVIIAENVKGMLIGNAKIYCKKIKDAFIDAGYQVQLFLLNAATMGVPQKRERVFFVARRKDLKLPELKLSFNEKPILFKEVFEKNNKERLLTENFYKVWLNRKNTDLDFSSTMSRVGRPNSYFNYHYIYQHKTPNTITGNDLNTLFDEPRYLSKNELCQIGSYPLDYNFGALQPRYLIGMSVPPVVMAQISYQIYLQWLNNL